MKIPSRPPPTHLESEIIWVWNVMAAGMSALDCLPPRECCCTWTQGPQCQKPSGLCLGASRVEPLPPLPSGVNALSREPLKRLLMLEQVAMATTDLLVQVEFFSSLPCHLDLSNAPPLPW